LALWLNGPPSKWSGGGGISRTKTTVFYRTQVYPLNSNIYFCCLLETPDVVWTTVCPTCSTGARVKWRCTAGSLSVGRRWQTALRSKCMARIHQSIRGSMNKLTVWSCKTLRLLYATLTNIWTAMWNYRWPTL